MIDDDGPTNGAELQERYANTIVNDDELVREAERDFLYGDFAAATRAALEAKAGTNGNGNGHG